MTQSSNITKFQVTKQFTSGIMEGLQITEVTRVQFQVGDVIKPCVGNSGYVVIACTKI